MSKRIIVCGGAGFIGSHVCKALAQAGHTPIVYDSLIRGHLHNVKWGDCIRADLMDLERLNKTFADASPDAVIHCAGLAYVDESFETPLAYWLTNVQGTLNVLRAMKLYGVKRIVFSSSCAVYGETDVLPIVEVHPKRPISPYGRTKQAAEDAIFDFCTNSDAKAMVLRYFNAAGADPDGELREQHDPETHLIPRAIQAAKNGTQFLINGDRHDTPDGTCVRDYIHVSDLARAHVLALEALDDPTFRYIPINLGTGLGHSVKYVLNEIESVSGQKIERLTGQNRIGDPPMLYCNASKAKEILGWTAKYTLRDMVTHAWGKPELLKHVETVVAPLKSW